MYYIANYFFITKQGDFQILLCNISAAISCYTSQYRLIPKYYLAILVLQLVVIRTSQYRLISKYYLAMLVLQ